MAFKDVVVLESVDSSNRYMNKIEMKPKLVLAETQFDGQGRMGRRWYSPLLKIFICPCIIRFKRGFLNAWCIISMCGCACSSKENITFSRE